MEKITKMENKIETKDFTLENLFPNICTVSVRDEDIVGNNSNPIVIDFGVVKDIPKTDLETDLIFISETLTIENVTAGCGCTKPILTDTEDPNKKGIKVRFDRKRITQNVNKWLSINLDNGRVLKMNLLINKK